MEGSLNNQKDIPTDERLILALDVPSVEEAKRLVESLNGVVHFYKIGLELFMTGRYFELLDWLTDRGHKVFVDLKFFDVPQTIASAIRQLRGRGASFATVHGNDPMLRAACGEKNGVGILAVTVLTSLDDGDMRDLGFQTNVRDLVLSRAKRALEIGCDGVISSGLEAPMLREHLGNRFLIVAPGIRPGANVDDQKRTVDVDEAFRNGADYIVVGRPIRNARDPVGKAREVQKIISSIFD